MSSKPTTTELVTVAVLIFVVEAFFYAFSDAAAAQWGYWIGLLLTAGLQALLFFMIAKGYYR